MTNFFALHNLQAVTGGRWLGESPPRDASATGLGHDTRSLKAGWVYLAVKGETFDGHDFLNAAFEQGASAAIVSDAVQPTEDRPILQVHDAVAALQELARVYRDRLAESGCKVVSVSGSNGKTTTRHLIHHVLTAGGLAGAQSPKSFNNHLGVPLTLLLARPGDAFVACEIGTNHPGEIEALAKLVRPDLAVITSLGEEHLEAFGDLVGVADEECALLPHVRPGGVVYAPTDTAELLAPRYDVADGVALQTLAGHAAVPDDLPLAGAHNRTNAALASAVGQAFGLEASTMRDALRTAEPPPHRMHLRQFGPVTLIDDCYNANPDSMAAALDELHGRPMPGRRVAILGDMLELGAREPSAHEEACQRAGEVAEVLILLGPRMERAARTLTDARRLAETTIHGSAQWRDDLPEVVAGLLQPGDVVLIKGSLGMGMMRLIPGLEARFG